MLDIIKKNYNNNIQEEEEMLSAPKPRLEEEGPTHQCYNIKNFWLFNPNTEELQVAPLCPRLEKIRLDFVFQDMNFSLDTSALASFSNLHSLDLNFYDNHNNALFENILKTCGDKLKCLVYNVCATYRSVNYKIIPHRKQSLTQIDCGLSQHYRRALPPPDLPDLHW